MPLTDDHLKNFCCLHGGSNQCRYLDEDLDDSGKVIYLCKKMSPDKKIIDEEILEFFEETKKSGQDPRSQGVPIGDNCQGYLPLKHKMQGYDKK